MTEDHLVRLRDLASPSPAAARPCMPSAASTCEVRRGEVVALIGESGSGKSVTLRTLLRLHPQTHPHGPARCTWRASDVLRCSQRELAAYRGKVASMIFQEPLLALDPVYPVGAQIVESIRRHEPCQPAPRRTRGRCSCSSACASPAPSGACRPIRTRCRAACASAP
jgi:peptide/nickel transport system ATP-binding protein